MKKISLLLVLMFSLGVYSQSVVGKWKTIDDETGKAKSIVEIYEKSGKIYGRVLDILEVENRNRICSNCSGED